MKSPKTRAGVRRAAVDSGTIVALAELRLAQCELAAVCDVSVRDDGFVFSMEPGGITPLHPDSLSHTFLRRVSLQELLPNCTSTPCATSKPQRSMLLSRNARSSPPRVVDGSHGPSLHGRSR